MQPKIVTCCYCGTRAALVLDRGRHELVCSSCGAPIQDLKSIPVKTKRSAEAVKEQPFARTRPQSFDLGLVSKPKKKQKKKKRTPMGKRLFDLIEDVVDDIFD